MSTTLAVLQQIVAMDTVRTTAQHVDRWGTVPQWISAFSVPAALYIILRDRQKARREQAAALLVWFDTSWKPESSSLIVLHNASSQPIFQLQLITEYKKGDQYIIDFHENTIQPSQQMRMVYPLSLSEDPLLGFWWPARSVRGHYLTFVDNQGVRWRKYINSEALIRVRPKLAPLHVRRPRGRKPVQLFDLLDKHSFAITVEQWQARHTDD